MKNTFNKAGENGNWLGDNVSKSGMHRWLAENYKIKYKCCNKHCLGESTSFDLALRKGFKYERKIENYIILCRSCHKRYDSKSRDNERSKILVDLRNKGFKWKDIGNILNMDFRNVARDYSRINFKIDLKKFNPKQKEK